MRRRVIAFALLAGACSDKDRADEYVRKSKAVEAKIFLKRLTRWAKIAYEEREAFPVGTVGPTPATPCCTHDKGVCPPDPALWQDPVWRALDFQIDEPFRFQYSYTSDGKTFTVTATGDVQCDGKPTTLTASGSLANGDVVLDDAQVSSKPATPR